MGMKKWRLVLGGMLCVLQPGLAGSTTGAEEAVKPVPPASQQTQGDKESVPVKLDPFPLLPESNEVLRQIKELQDNPLLVKVREIADSLEESRKRLEQQNQSVHEELNRLTESQEYNKLSERMERLRAQLDDKWQKERLKFIEAVNAIYSARHAEIRQHAPSAIPSGAKLGFTILNYPRIDGSTSTGPLTTILACRLLGLNYEWIYPEVSMTVWQRYPGFGSRYLLDGDELSEFGWTTSRFATPEMSLAALRVVAKPSGASTAQERMVKVVNSLLAVNTSTHKAYVNLIEGKTDLSLVARTPSQSETALAAQKGVRVRTVTIALDAFVFLVNKDNPLRSLTRQQLRDIYEKRISDWNALLWRPGKINAYVRERDSGSRELFDALVPEKRSAPESAGSAPVKSTVPSRADLPETGNAFSPRERDGLYAYGMGGPFSRLTRDKDGIAYSIYYYEHFMAASPETRVIAVDGVEPSAATIASGAYPWVTPVYAAYREGDADNAPAMTLLRWLLSEEGQSVIAESGYVPAQGRKNSNALSVEENFRVRF